MLKFYEAQVFLHSILTIPYYGKLDFCKNNWFRSEGHTCVAFCVIMVSIIGNHPYFLWELNWLYDSSIVMLYNRIPENETAILLLNYVLGNVPRYKINCMICLHCLTFNVAYIRGLTSYIMLHCSIIAIQCMY